MHSPLALDPGTRSLPQLNGLPITTNFKANLFKQLIGMELDSRETLG
jgi:hypothetical protein